MYTDTESLQNFNHIVIKDMLNHLHPASKSFGVFYDHDENVYDHFGEVPRDFPKQLTILKQKLTLASCERDDSDSFIGKIESYDIRLFNGNIFSNNANISIALGVPCEEYVDRILSMIPTGIIKLNSSWIADYCNGYAEHLLGLSNQEILGRGWLSVLNEEIIISAEQYFKNGDHFIAPYKSEIDLITPLGKKRVLSFQISASQSLNNMISEYFIVFQDFTSEHTARESAYHLASHDNLTGLKNRSYLIKKIEQAIANNKISESAIVYIDLNDFKIINDTYGHLVGDEVLKIASKRLQNSVRHDDVVARIGGDEFVLFLSNVCEGELKNTVAKKIKNSLNQPMSLDNNITIDFVSSIGISHGESLSLIAKAKEDIDIDIDSWLKSADFAMYSSKKGKKGEVEVFDEAFYKKKLEEQKHLSIIQELVQKNDLNIVFQPIYKDNAVFSIEALARFNHPELDLSIGEIIKLATKFNFQRILFDCLLVAGIKAYKAVVSNLADSQPPPKLNINIDIEQLSRNNFTQFCLELIDTENLKAENIYLEITENALEIETYRIKSNIEALKAHGFKLSMDDFGTGYSSIRRLIGYEFEQLKIDRSFVNGAPENTVLQSCLSAAIQLGRALRMDVLCEGIECEAEFQLVKKMGVNQYQGFYFSKPKKQSEMVNQLNHFNKGYRSAG